MTGNSRELLYSVFRVKMLLRLNRLARSADVHVANQRPGISPGDWEAIRHDVVSKLGCRKTDRIVEIGCGTGLLGEAIVRHVKLYVGYDLIHVLLQRAKKGTPSECACFVRADGRALPMRNESVDRILIYSVVLYLPPAVLRTLLRECLRVLKFGGFMLLGDIPNPDRVINFLTRGSGKRNRGWTLIRLRTLVFLAKKGIQRILHMPGGGWYRPYDIMRILVEEGFDCECADQPSRLPYSHYRYDCIAKRARE